MVELAASQMDFSRLPFVALGCSCFTAGSLALEALSLKVALPACAVTASVGASLGDWAWTVSDTLNVRDRGGRERKKENRRKILRQRETYGRMWACCSPWCPRKSPHHSSNQIAPGGFCQIQLKYLMVVPSTWAVEYVGGAAPPSPNRTNLNIFRKSFYIVPTRSGTRNHH